MREIKFTIFLDEEEGDFDLIYFDEKYVGVAEQLVYEDFLSAAHRKFVTVDFREKSEAPLDERGQPMRLP